MSYDNTNSGILTRNDKQGNENRPDYRGSINVDGVDYWLSAWIKEGRDGTKLAGQKYMSLSVQPKEVRQDYAAPAPAPSPAPAPRRQTQAEQDARAIAERRERAAAPKPTSGTGFDGMEDDIPF
jgi:hypothetical protein